MRGQPRPGARRRPERLMAGAPAATDQSGRASIHTLNPRRVSMSSRTLAQEELHESTWAWWLFMLLGLVGIAAGVIVLAKPSNSLATLAVIAGIFILVDGIFDLVASLLGRAA